MSKKSTLPQSRHHIFIFDEDWEWISLYSAAAQLNNSEIIRAWIHQRVQYFKARQFDAIDGTPTTQPLQSEPTP